MPNYRPIWLLAGCGILGTSAAVAVVLQPNSSAPPDAVKESVAVSSQEKPTAVLPAAQGQDAAASPVNPSPAATPPAPPHFTPVGYAPPSAESHAAALLSKQMESMERSLEGLRETNQLHRQSFERALGHLEQKLQQRSVLPSPISTVPPPEEEAAAPSCGCEENVAVASPSLPSLPPLTSTILDSLSRAWPAGTSA